MNYAESAQIRTHIFDYVNIPKFDLANKKHLQISYISKDAHSGETPPSDAILILDKLLLEKD